MSKQGPASGVPGRAGRIGESLPGRPNAPELGPLQLVRYGARAAGVKVAAEAELVALDRHQDLWRQSIAHYVIIGAPK